MIPCLFYTQGKKWLVKSNFYFFLFQQGIFFLLSPSSFFFSASSYRSPIFLFSLMLLGIEVAVDGAAWRLSLSEASDSKWGAFNNTVKIFICLSHINIDTLAISTQSLSKPTEAITSRSPKKNTPK